MPEYESHNFEHITDEIIHNKNPREELDKMYPNDADKLRVVKTAIKKMRLELHDLGEADSTNYSHEEIATLERLPDDIAVFESMEKELEATVETKKDGIKDIQELGKID